MTKIIISTTVIKGLGLAKKLGWPTMNCSLQNIPRRLAQGVYAAQVQTRFGNFGGVAYFGPRLFHKKNIVFEIHCFGFKKNMYRKRITVILKKRLRGVKTFAAETTLQKQVQRDIQAARAYVHRPSNLAKK